MIIVRTRLRTVYKVIDTLTNNFLSTNYRLVYTNTLQVIGRDVFLTINLGFYWIMKRIKREKVNGAT